MRRLALNLVVVIYGNIDKVAVIHTIQRSLLWIIEDVTPHILSGAILYVYFPPSYLFSDEEKRGLIYLVLVPELMRPFTSDIMVD